MPEPTLTLGLYSCELPTDRAAAPLVSAATADRRIRGDRAWANLGYRVEVGDLLPGGSDEILASASSLVRGGTDWQRELVGVFALDTESLSAAPVSWSHDGPLNDLFGAALAVADADGDGDADVLIGTIGYTGRSTRFELFAGPLDPAGEVVLDDEPAFVGPWDDQDDLAQSGGGIAALGDWAGDGVQVVAVATVEPPSRGQISLVPATPGAHWTTQDAVGELDLGEVAGPGGLVLTVADLVGGAEPELVVGVTDSDGSRHLAVFDRSTGPRTAADAVVRIAPGPDRNPEWHLELLGDLDGDGSADVLFGEPTRSLGAGSRDGVLTVAYGPFDQSTVGADQLVTLMQAEFPSDFLGTAVARLGDLDGDGHDEFAIGSAGDPLSDGRAGKVHVFRGPLAAPLSAADAAFALVGECGWDGFGWELAAGDLDGDGRDDLVVGAPWRRDPESNAVVGGLYVFTGAAIAARL